MTTYPLRVGVQLHQQHTTYQDFTDAVRRVEDMGVDTIFVGDHFFPLYGDPQGYHFEAWTLLTALAMLTSKAKVGCLVTGAGMFLRDYQEYGYEFGTPGSRLDTLERALQIVRQRWEVDVPPPLHKIPILIGGDGEKRTLRLVAQYADAWHGHGDPDVYRHKVTVLRDWCARVERDPEEIECAVSPFGPVSADLLDAYAEAGVTHFIVGMGRHGMNAPWNFDKLAQVLEWRASRHG